MTPLARGEHVIHAAHGRGQVELDLGDTTIVRFGHGLEEVLSAELRAQPAPAQVASRGDVQLPLDVLTRLQAELITSINDTWGVFARSRIALLPHQLWVCRQVLREWPPRWLVADDVGLGKTVEAGLILWPLLSRRQVRRFLIICPAGLVEQWQERLRRMFDIRVSRYHPDLDHARADYWNGHHQVVVSLQTIREDHDGRHGRLLAADPWDLVIVDEAHHLNVDDQAGATLGYRLVDRLMQAGRIGGLVLFTATPHRGKDRGFVSLLELLRPDLFDARKPLAEQLPQLSRVVIRNNKQNVTDLQGRRLFHPPRVQAETYRYSPAEADFYRMLTEFVASGQAYASTLGDTQGSQAVTLVLIALQKLASSSVAAVRRALHGRLARLRAATSAARGSRRWTEQYRALEGQAETEAVNALDEEVGEWASWVRLMEHELERLEELVAAADRVEEETKLQAILAAVTSRFEGRSVLFFTEYKATQAALMGELGRRYGEHSVAFINGDGRIEVSGRTLTLTRQEASARFNRGEVRFLVATEAAGEGIDLQGVCHTLVHVDLPWNPMRLHQRVGRLNRYGQTRQVDVLTLRNEDTVEALIWDRLTEKLGRVMQAFGEVMDEPEDLLQMVLGMTSPSLFRDLFTGAQSIPRDALGAWFDAGTGHFGGRDVVDVVRDLVGHSARFDYQEVSRQIPRVDLPDLEPFLRNALNLNRRQVRHDDGLTFKTPEAWAGEIGVLRSYRGLTFDRSLAGEDLSRVVGVGHKVLDAALGQARGLEASVTVLTVRRPQPPLLVYRVFDRVTARPAGERGTLVGVRLGPAPTVLRDWEALLELNALQAGTPGSPRGADLQADVERAQDIVQGRLDDLHLTFARPQVEFLGGIWFQGPEA
ncbi:helicase [Deinococcus seoulensis]|uniref:Helicase n=1 Tax=Deinococcus seoulensis TaxID=1837379 RepID=A0ABQ2RX82_9DEIO|nr:DEAD/DEAH box helicase [Deinococcus seoulensis]GGR71718.1 helicase [Deinococcus seoulensis]